MPDFIVLGEFNEKVGPESKLVLAASGQPGEILAHFDVEGFVLRVMSVELNADPNDADFITTMELNEFKLFCVIQHISLNDLFARGYVRRIVLAYLTQDQSKLMNFFNLFKGYFDRVTFLLKDHNKAIFENDIKRRIADLIETEKASYSNALAQAISPSPFQIKESIEDMKHLYLRQKGLDVEKLESNDEISKLLEIPQEEISIPEYSPKVLQTLQHAESLMNDRRQRSLEDIAGSNWGLVKQELESMLSRLKKSDIVLSLENQTFTSTAQPQSLLKIGFTPTINFNFKDCSWDHQIDFEKFLADSVDESCPCEPNSMNFSGDGEMDSVECFGNVIWSFSAQNCGIGLLSAKNQYSFAANIVFSLLRGRPVIITGRKDQQSEIKSLVQAFSIFVPNNTTTLKLSQPQVVPWFTQPLLLQHLAHLKLIGTDNLIPFSVNKYVTVFDVEKKVMKGPYYRDGDFIMRILSDKKHWPNDQTYVAYVHAQLYEIGMLACLYYHECCVGIPPHSAESMPVLPTTALQSDYPKTLPNFRGAQKPPATQSTINSFSLIETSLKNAEREQAKIRSSILSQQNQSKISFFKRHHIKENDAEILQYLSEVVKMQQSASIRGIKKSPIIQLDYSQIFQFENKTKQRRF
uniref:UDENN FLCN/SMCR8-type domain-containing protein n=1 Tax=Arcella intermedia TaxID=1963864 RepID=A0A6B2KZH5_9EUKA